MGNAWSGGKLIQCIPNTSSNNPGTLDLLNRHKLKCI